MEDQDFQKVFPENNDWFWKNAMKVRGGTESLFDVENTGYYLAKDNEESIVGDQDAYYISKNKIGKSTRMFQNLESILEHRIIVARCIMKDELGLEELVEIRRKNHSIRINEVRVSGPLEFDHVDELKQILIDEYNAKRLVPITYTPWDSIDRHVEGSRFVNDLTLLYLYDNRVFEISR